MILTESVDAEICKKIAGMSFSNFLNLFTNDNSYETETVKRTMKGEYKKITNYCKGMIDCNFTRKIEYYTTEKCPRYFSKGSLQGLNKLFRGALVCNLYFDFDMINCGPTIIKYLCNKFDIECNELTRYIKIREQVFLDFQASHDIPRDEIKIFFIRSINNDKRITYINKKKIKDPFFLKFDIEMKSIQRKFRDHFKEEYNYIKNNCDKNIGGNLMYYIYIKYETIIMKKVHSEFKANVNSFDGFMICQNESGKVAEPIEKLNEITSEYNIKWSQKEIDSSIYNKILEMKNPENKSIIKESLFEIGIELLKTTYSERLVYCQNKLYFKCNQGWVSNDRMIDKHLYDELTEMDLYTYNPTKKCDVLVRNKHSNVEELIKVLIKKANTDDKMIDKIFDHTLHKIYFQNGYYDFDTGVFNKNDYNSFVIIPNEYHFKPNLEIRKEIYRRILNPIFTIYDEDNDKSEREELRDYFIYKMSRIVAGNIEDKEWVINLGFRDCGKGCLTDLFINCFQNYCCNANAESFLLKSNNGDSAKNNSFMADWSFKRIIFMNECSTSDDRNNKSVLDGNKIKKIISGGDYVTVRKNFQDEWQMRTQASICGNMNELVSVEPTDALSKCKIFNYTSTFIDSDYSGVKLTNIRYMEKDDKVKTEFIKREEVQREFILMIFEAHKKPCKYPKRLERDFQEDVEDDISKLINLFEFTNDKDDFISSKDLKSIIENHDIKFGIQKINSILTGNGAKKTRQNNLRGLNFIKIKSEQ